MKSNLKIINPKKKKEVFKDLKEILENTNKHKKEFFPMKAKITFFYFLN
jgi:hypothetical protein